MPATKLANSGSFSIRQVIEWTLPLLLSLCALAMLLTSYGRVCLDHRFFSFARSKKLARSQEAALRATSLLPRLRD